MLKVSDVKLEVLGLSIKGSSVKLIKDPNKFLHFVLEQTTSFYLARHISINLCTNVQNQLI